MEVFIKVWWEIKLRTCYLFKHNIYLFHKAQAKREMKTYMWSFSQRMHVCPSVLEFQKQSALMSSTSWVIPLFCIVVVKTMYLKFLLWLRSYLTDSSLVWEINVATNVWLYSLLENILLHTVYSICSASTLICPKTTLSEGMMSLPF